jgi:hypothetical protein
LLFSLQASASPWIISGVGNAAATTPSAYVTISVTDGNGLPITTLTKQNFEFQATMCDNGCSDTFVGTVTVKEWDTENNNIGVYAAILGATNVMENIFVVVSTPNATVPGKISFIRQGQIFLTMRQH